MRTGSPHEPKGATVPQPLYSPACMVRNTHPSVEGVDNEPEDVDEVRHPGLGPHRPAGPQGSEPSRVDYSPSDVDHRSLHPCHAAET